MSHYEDLSAYITPVSGITVSFWRVGKVAYVKAESNSIALVAGWNALAYIESAAYRPRKNLYGFGYIENSGDSRTICETCVDTNGTVRIFSLESATLLARLSLVFPMA